MVKKTVLITGGAGFIGYNILKKINKKKYKIIVIDNFSSYQSAEYKKKFKKFIRVHNIKFLQKNIRNLKGNEIKNTKIVIHLAANPGIDISIKKPVKDLKENVETTLTLLELCRKAGVEKFIFSSSNAVVGNAKLPINEKSICNPISNYGNSKLCAENYCKVYSKIYNIKCVILRFGNVFGPGSENKKSVVASFVKSSLNYKEIYIFGSGKQTRDFIFIDQLISCILKCMNIKISSYEIFQTSCGKQTSIISLAKKVRYILKNKFNLKTEIIFKKARKGDILHNFSSINKVKSKLNWKPKLDINKMLEKTINDLINVYQKKNFKNN